MGDAGVDEGGEAVIGGAIVAAPAAEVRYLHGNVGSRGQDLIHEDLHAAFGVPDGRGAQVNQDGHAEAIGRGENIAQLTDLCRIIKAKLRIGEMQFESTTQTDAGAMIDGGESVRTRGIDAAEADQTLRI